MTGTGYRLVPVTELARGDRIVLPNGKVVFCQRVDSYDAPPPRGKPGERIYLVRWACGTRLRPPHALAGSPSELGSLEGLYADALVRCEA